MDLTWRRCVNGGVKVSHLAGGLPIITVTHSPQHGWNSAIKRLYDVVGSVTALVILAIPMGILALLIKFSSPGSVFYCQRRTSLGGKPFKIIKFRTMMENAEANTGPVWAASKDARVTWIGRFLRRTSLDELPQMFNILLGQMSLVGPSFPSECGPKSHPRSNSFVRP